jgi:hypothetical protein
LQAPAKLDSKKSKAHVAKRNQIHRSGIFHSQWKQGLGKHASGQPWQEQHQPLDIWSAFHTPRADDGIKKIMARISRHHHGRNGTLRSAPDLDHIGDLNEMIGLSRRHQDTEKNSLPERRRPRRHQRLRAMTLRQLRNSAKKCVNTRDRPL